MKLPGLENKFISNKRHVDSKIICTVFSWLELMKQVKHSKRLFCLWLSMLNFSIRYCLCTGISMLGGCSMQKHFSARSCTNLDELRTGRQIKAGTPFTNVSCVFVVEKCILLQKKAQPLKNKVSLFSNAQKHMYEPAHRQAQITEWQRH